MNGHALAEIGVGKISPRLRSVVKQLATHSAALADKIHVAMNEGIGDYANVRDQRSDEDVHASISFNVDLWYRALLSGQPPSNEDLQRLAEFGRHRVSHGVSLPGLLRAYRIGSRVIWEELLDQATARPEIERELLAKVSPYILYHFDLLGQTTSQAYSQQVQQQARWRDRARHDLASVIFRSPDDIDAFREQILALGLDGSAPHVAVAVGLQPQDGGTQTTYPEFDMALQALSHETDLTLHEFLYFRRHDRFLAWFPLQNGESALQGERRIHRASVAAGQQLSCKVGCGLPQTGPIGWRRSAEQAIRSIELGARLEPDKTAFRYLDVCLPDAVLTDEGSTRFLQTWIERLSQENHLLQTLQIYFDYRGYRKIIAAELKIHPNTLAYRLDRINQILEVELDDPKVQALLHTAIRLRQLAQD